MDRSKKERVSTALIKVLLRQSIPIGVWKIVRVCVRALGARIY